MKLASTTTPSDQSELDYIGVPAAARCLGIDRSTLARICRRVLKEEHYLGYALAVKETRGRGGRSGVRYLIAVDSFPEGLRLLLGGRRAHEETVEEARGPEEVAGSVTLTDCELAAIRAQRGDPSEVTTKLKAIIPICATTRRHSPERAQAIVKAAAETKVDKSTISRWIHQYARYGVAGLARRRGRPVGQSICISRAFDTAFREAGGSQAQLQNVRNYLVGTIKSVFASPASNSGKKHCVFLVKEALLAYCEAFGWHVRPEAIAISPKLIDEHWAEYSLVNVYLHDARGFRNQAPGIGRTKNGLRPMDIVFSDVKYLRWRIRGDDGILYRLAKIAFFDVATSRLRQDLLLLNRPGLKNDDVSSEDIIKAYSDMACHPEWGVPEVLYIDNGSNYNLLADLHWIISRHREGVPRPVLRAAPWHPETKPIEGAFAVFQHCAESKIAGFAGFDKRRTWCDNLAEIDAGVFPGSWEDFQEEFRSAAELFHELPFKGGPTRADSYRMAVQDGHQARVQSPSYLYALYGELTQRTIRKGAVSFGGEKFTCDGVIEAPGKSKAEMIIPAGRGVDPIHVDRNNVSPMRRDRPFRYLDPAGRAEAKRRRDRQVAAVQRRLGEVDLGLADRLRDSFLARKRLQNGQQAAAPDSFFSAGGGQFQDLSSLDPSPVSARTTHKRQLARKAAA
ncbi:MAG: helix-turn-helix domain-containing protein [Allosphingosinicella sp.]|uniref:helix-turn-helix domain-containing protein n=1 Tax=Allosphingosinicella sp. TaxID=2823234 RepID=UPI003943780E